jgi:hypothetical protein
MRLIRLYGDIVRLIRLCGDIIRLSAKYWKCHGSGHELEYNVLNRVVIEEGYVRVTMRG